MAKSNTFAVSVITPERAVLEVEATSASIPAHDGEIGILPMHAPLLVKLGAGWMRVEAGSESHRLLVAGGFAQVIDNRLSVLTEHAQAPEEIDREAAQEALKEARALPVTDDASFETRQRAIQHAKAQLAARN